MVKPVYILNVLDYAELERLQSLGMKRVLCDFNGTRWAYGDAGVTEKLKKGVLLCVTPFDDSFVIEDALKGAPNAEVH
ncbi:MAG: hypothetical protein VB062_04695 [Christensenella sp.]|nr:hypothetical protein [Christensenella sp.]